jgi:hypothetical protein
MIMPIPRFYVHLYIHSGEIPQVQGKLTDVILDQTQVRMEMHFFLNSPYFYFSWSRHLNISLKAKEVFRIRFRSPTFCYSFPLYSTATL